jgi:chromosome segregation ATPase
MSALQEQVRTLADQLQEANADRRICHRDIATLTAHLKEANADREVCHRDILTLTGHLKEANADRNAIYGSRAFKILSRLTGRATS